MLKKQKNNAALPKQLEGHQANSMWITSILRRKKKKSATQVLFWVLAHSSFALSEYEILIFPQQNLAWLKEEYFFFQQKA